MPPSKPARADVRKLHRAGLSDELRDRLDRDGRSLTAIAKASGVPQSALSRFLAGERGLTLDTADRLAAELGLHLVGSARTRGKPRRDIVPQEPPVISVSTEITESIDTTDESTV